MYIKFNNTYAKMPPRFYKTVYPVLVKDPQLLLFNTNLADELRIRYEINNSQEIAEVLAGNKILPGSKPIATVYAGHQFGHFVPILGDGRAVLLGETTDKYGKKKEIQLKGSGKTPFSRQGDGRAALGPMIREYIVSESMHALGIKTTRSLAVVTTGETVLREHPFPGAILTRIAESHIRIGTFEYFAAQNDWNAVQILADYIIDRQYPEEKTALNPYVGLLRAVCNEQISLVIEWMRVGFVHGVMNTDNMALSGETIDYGPCAFMDNYHPHCVFSSIDYYGRYAFNNQLQIVLWNLTQLANTLRILINQDPKKMKSIITELFNELEEIFTAEYLKMMAKKIGLTQLKRGDIVLIEELLMIMKCESSDFTLTFRYLSDYVLKNTAPLYWEKLLSPSTKMKNWMDKWLERLQQEAQSPEMISKLMLETNPAVIPRNHRIEEVTCSALNKQDISQTKEFINVLAHAYVKPESIKYMQAPEANERITQTFCGT